MIFFLILLNIAMILIFCRIIFVLKISITSLFLFSYIIFNVIGFLVIGSDPNGFIWNYLNPDMRRIFAFSLGSGKPQIYFITIVNLSLLLGLTCGLFNWSKETSITNSIDSIVEKNKNLLEPLAWYFFIVSLCYMIIRFYFVSDLPLYQLMIHGGATRSFSDAWLANKNVSWIFLPSVYMQFLQFFQPISCLLFYFLYELNKSKRTFIIFIFSLLVNFISLIAILKRGPLIVFGASIILMLFIYRNRIKFDKSVNLLGLLCGSFFLLTGVFGITKLQEVPHYNALFPSNVILQSKEEISFKKPPVYFDFFEKSFKMSKFPLDFSKNMNKIKTDYNEKHYGPLPSFSPSQKIISMGLCRIFVEEMIASFIIVGNPELITYIENSNPIHTYMLKVLGYKTKKRHLTEDR